MIKLNAVSILVEVKALVSRKAIFYFIANSSPSFVGISLLSAKSILFPISNTIISCTAFSLIVSNHLAAYSNDFLLVISYTNKAPTAPL